MLSSKEYVTKGGNENEEITNLDEKIDNTKIMSKFVTQKEKFKNKLLMLKLLQRILADFTGYDI